MSDLSYLMQLQERRRQEGQEAWQGVGENISNLLEQRAINSFSQAATKHFMSKGVSPESLQEFQSMYPNAPPQAVMQIAGGIQKQNEAQELKDVYKSVVNFVETNGRTPNAKEMAGIMGNNPALGEKFIQMVEQFKKMNPKSTMHNVPENAIGVQLNEYGNPTGERVTGLAKEPEMVQVQLYNLKDPTKTKKVSVEKGKDYTPDEGWTIGTAPTAGETWGEEGPGPGDTKRQVSSKGQIRTTYKPTPPPVSTSPIAQAKEDRRHASQLRASALSRISTAQRSLQTAFTPDAKKQWEATLAEAKIDLTEAEDLLKEADAVLHPKKAGKASKQKTLDKTTALSILKEAGGDKNKARQIAKERGYSF